MSHTTPHVVNGSLFEPHAQTGICLDTPAWHAWLAEAEHRSFHFCHPTGEFTARKERKQRGTSYWVAYRQAHNHLYKRYLGKSDTLTHDRLIAAATALTQLCTATHAPPHP